MCGTPPGDEGSDVMTTFPSHALICTKCERPFDALTPDARYCRRPDCGWPVLPEELRRYVVPDHAPTASIEDEPPERPKNEVAFMAEH